MSSKSDKVSPLQLLENKGDKIPSFLSDKWDPFMLATSGFLIACFTNYLMRKPTFSGIQKHIGLTISGGLIGYYFDQKRGDFLAERDAVLRQYIKLHPEDFPDRQREKYADVLQQWVPIR